MNAAVDYALAHVVGVADIMRIRVEAGREIAMSQVENLEKNVAALRQLVGEQGAG